MMNEIIEKENIIIEEMIYEVRGVHPRGIWGNSDTLKKKSKDCGSNLEPQKICLELTHMYLPNKE